MTEAWYAEQQSTMAQYDSVTAIKYVAVSVVKQPDGAGVYSYVFHLRTASGAVYSLGARYSVFRRLSSLLLAEQPDACQSLPPFPPKHSMRRQTPEFLLTRGKALESYLGGALGDPRLSALPAVRELLRAAELHRPACSLLPASPLPSGRAAASGELPTPYSPDESPSAATPAARGELHLMQRSSVKMRSIAAHSNGAVGAGAVGAGAASAAAAAIEAAASASSPAAGDAPFAAPSSEAGTAMSEVGGATETEDSGMGKVGRRGAGLLLHPLVSLICALLLGRLSQQSALCFGCCALGLAAGRVCRSLGWAGASSSAAIAPPSSSGGGLNGGGGGMLGDERLPNGGGPPSRLQGAREDGGALRQRRGVDRSAGGDLDAEAHRVAAEAVAGMEALAQAVAVHRDPASGWKRFDTKDGVDIFLNSRADGSTWVLGLGTFIERTEVVLGAMEDDTNQPTLDKLLESSRLLRELPPRALRADGWECLKLVLMQSLYRSPAWPVGPRESCTVRLKARRVSDGAVINLQRSVELPGVVPPKGYTRITLSCGGYELVQTADGGTRMTYVNLLNPNGNIPNAVIYKTAPDRAMVISRLRKCLEKRR